MLYALFPPAPLAVWIVLAAHNSLSHAAPCFMGYTGSSWISGPFLDMQQSEAAIRAWKAVC